jgi:G3E family GTPase
LSIKAWELTGAEFGNTADIEKSISVNQDERQTEEWIPLANGCLCCSIKDSGVAALEALVERQKDKKFDYILLETTGVADPGNIAPMFWMDEGMGSSIYLDGIVTVADAKNILKSLDEPTQEELPNEADHAHGAGPLMSVAHLQISHADIILLNKTDLVSQEQRTCENHPYQELSRRRSVWHGPRSRGVFHLSTSAAFPRQGSFSP